MEGNRKKNRQKKLRNEKNRHLIFSIRKVNAPARIEGLNTLKIL
jgi:hypothetical protein